MKLKKRNNSYINYSGDRISIVGKYNAKVTSMASWKSVVVWNTTNSPLFDPSFFRAIDLNYITVNEVELQEDYKYVNDQIKTQFSQVIN